MEILDFTAPGTGSWLVQLIALLVKISSSVWLGVILFTIVLKLVTLPFDYASRASMRKNSLKMEQMRPELEKLQEQYADNKDIYNQKMMALYKKNGYSMFGACLPTILTLVIFIVAINAFTDYSKFQNQRYFYNMANSYNNVIYAGFELDSEERYIYRDANGKIVVNLDNIITDDENKDNKLDVNDSNYNSENNFEIEYEIVSDPDKQSEGEKEYKIFELKTRLSKNLKKLRKEKNWSQFELAEKADLSEQTINSIENIIGFHYKNPCSFNIF